MASPLAGKLIVASPSLLDTNFHRSVVLILAHGDHGAFGVILNRPLELPVIDHLPAWAPWVASPAVFFAGGPVERTATIGVARGSFNSEIAAMAEGYSLVDLEQAPAQSGAVAGSVRLFNGYAGWGEGQLERELEQKAWFVVPTHDDDLFTPDPGQLWTHVLRRQRGELAMLAHFPVDARAN